MKSLKHELLIKIGVHFPRQAGPSKKRHYLFITHKDMALHIVPSLKCWMFAVLRSRTCSPKKPKTGECCSSSWFYEYSSAAGCCLWMDNYWCELRCEMEKRTFDGHVRTKAGCTYWAAVGWHTKNKFIGWVKNGYLIETQHSNDVFLLTHWL